MPRARRNQKKEQEKVEDKGEDIAKKEEKTQPITKPKKYVKKSIDAIQRIERSKHQRIFLLEAVRVGDDQWSFMVLGASGSQYHVTVSTTVRCTCIDFRMKKKPCKHIFFIVTQVAQNQEILDYFRSTTATISKAAYKILDQQLTERLKSRLQGKDKKDSKDIDLKDDTDCTICFTEMDKENQTLEDCPQCKKYFHEMCISAWKNHNPTCPLCRGNLIAKSGQGALSQLKGIKINE